MKNKRAQTSRRKVNVAVVGLGFMGVTHLKAYRQIPGARLVAVCDAVRLPVNGVLAGVSGNIHSSDALDLGRNLRTYRRLEDLLADAEVDLVDLCVPTPLHPSQAIAALRSGKHVLCEKPLARTSALAREIVKAARVARGCFMPAMCMRFWPGWAELKGLVARRTYGRALTARFRRVSAPPGWSRASYFKGDESGGALLDLHVHDADFAMHLLGRPQAITAQGWGSGPDGFDRVHALWHYPSTPCVQIEGFWDMPPGFGFNMGFTARFEKAAVVWDLCTGKPLTVFPAEGQPCTPEMPSREDGYFGEISYFLTCIAQQGEPVLCRPRDSRDVISLMHMEADSIRTGRTVQIPASL